MASRVMSDAEIRRRKHLQGKISQTTSTLGLTGLGALGAGAVVSRKPGVLRKIPKYKNLTNDQVKAKGKSMGDTATKIGIVSGGIGGLGGYNFAAYTNAESRKKKAVVKRDETSPLEDGHYAEVGIAKNWSPSNSKFDPERSRQKRAKVYEGAAETAGVAGVAYGGARGIAGAGHSVAARKKTQTPEGKAKHLKLARMNKKPALVGASVGVAGLSAAEMINRKRNSSWQPYAKSASTSAFGVVHH